MFYAYSQQAFYRLTVSTTGVRSLTAESGWIARTGRQALYFQYRHNSPLTNRIDPGTTNIIDLYVVTRAYYTAYQNWLRDTTGTVTEPNVPTIDELNTAYQQLQDYKMLSDNIVLNSVTFKPLFGPKATKQLQATIKVIRAQNSVASISEIKSSVLAAMNDYFSIDKWSFGDTFYFSELAAYLHRYLGTIVSSVVLVPLDTQKYFGDLYEIRAEPNEIFANGATIDNIVVIDALTSTNLRTAPGSGVI
jgi:putative flippase GtrA